MNLSDELHVELTDVITDWIMEEASQRICSSCSLNREENGTTTCPCDFDLFSCPNSIVEISDVIQQSVDAIVTALPEPEPYDFFDYVQ